MPDKISELLEETKIREGYQNIDGKPVLLEKLVRDDPDWACSRIRHMTAEVERLRQERDHWKAAYDREAIDRKDCLQDMHLEREYRQRDKVVRNEALAEVRRLRGKLEAVVTSSNLGGRCPPGMIFGHEDMCPPPVTFSNSFSNGRICPVFLQCWQKWIDA